jgi:hypothetical protein
MPTHRTQAPVTLAAAYDLPLAAARSSYAHLAGVDRSVAVGSQVSVFAGLIAANLPDGSEVLTATGDFTSILFPFYAQSGRGIRDVSPAWHAWVAAAPAVRLLAQVGPSPCTGTPLAWRTGFAPE